MNTLCLAHPNSLIDFFKKIDARPKKCLSQNFLIDRNVIDHFVEVAEIKPGDLVLEIGPGAGAITEALLKTKATIIAVEKDPKLANSLKKRFAGTCVQVIEGDILDLNLDALIPKKAKVISNLPFQITSLILVKLLPKHRIFESLTFIMQKELAQRINSAPNSKLISSLSIFSTLYSNVSMQFDISKNSFFPKPNVDSNAIKFTLKDSCLEHSENFINFVRKGFSQRRKMLSSVLPYSSKETQKTLRELELNPKARAENLSLDDWINLFKKLSSQ